MHWSCAPHGSRTPTLAATALLLLIPAGARADGAIRFAGPDAGYFALPGSQRFHPVRSDSAECDPTAARTERRRRNDAAWLSLGLLSLAAPDRLDRLFRFAPTRTAPNPLAAEGTGVDFRFSAFDPAGINQTPSAILPAAPLPEPGTLALVATGIAALWIGPRRRARKNR